MFRHTSVAVGISILAGFGIALLSYYRASADFVAVVLLLVVSGSLFGLCWMATLYWVARVGIRPHHAFNDVEFESLGQLRYVCLDQLLRVFGTHCCCWPQPQTAMLFVPVDFMCQTGS